jgi:hypothetical protein
VIPLKVNRKVSRRYNKTLYRQRNRMEQCFSKLKLSVALPLASRNINATFTFTPSSR